MCRDHGDGQATSRSVITLHRVRTIARSTLSNMISLSPVQPAGLASGREGTIVSVTQTRPPDSLDARLIELFAKEPRIGVLECSRRLGVARGTVQARLDKLVDRGVIRGFGPEISPTSLGFGVTAFVTLEISQRFGHDPVAAHLNDIPEV